MRMLGVKRLWQAPSNRARQASEVILNNDMLILGSVNKGGCVVRVQAGWTVNNVFGSLDGRLELFSAPAVYPACSRGLHPTADAR
ncbi:hypothetical protein ALO95_101590 [Pseudomonas syringae pv. antirrhini]|uniref:Uncharacterized protein n=4 Tax=Pseudomonas syringae group TaxID=136849 RepID=A0A0Q0F3G8_PSESX|nr:hypothetical protein ALO54_101648 [Pseudomonas syringae pv. philadelphi]KPY58068.1 hypothetical protein ALO94_100582 [Pseudomonas syringae pv. spinaceae]RMP31163.1 hypothetical protein ALQ24_101963 [Pseudomonas syringae pv. antirrhini]RMP67536.1 hypothetical protein ALQ19_101714 [Pseudomonas syringae pv. berberidis]RMQ26146.1 hypothetical protein ALQ07_102115 [Pseudomonas syringae pv. actinidiae]RMQ80424.1 hypothetical protein ALQ00_101671 [Pseudomonas syringae pv. tomato]